MSIDAGTVRVLTEHRSKQAEERLLAGQGWRGDDHVVTTSLGSPIFPDTASHLMPRLIDAHNKPKDGTRPPVDSAPLRPTARPPTRPSDNTAAGRSAGARGGRTARPRSPSITLRVYAHVIRQHAADVAEVFAREVEDVDEVIDDGDLPAIAAPAVSRSVGKSAVR